MASLFTNAVTIQKKLEAHLGTTAANVAVQDGRDAGQSVPHVHIHILPRKPGDFKYNDDVYKALDAVDVGTERCKTFPIDDSERRDRSLSEMAAEASSYRSLFPESQLYRI